MFYLNHFWKLLTASPLRGIGLGVVQVLILIMIMNQSFFEKNFIRDSKEDEPRFFHTVFTDKKSVNELKKNLVKLPGILSVIEATDSFDSHSLNYLPEDLKQVVMKDVTDQKYFSLKISLDDKIDLRSEELVRNFITKYHESTFLGMTETSEKKEGSVPFVEKYLFYEVLFALMLLWVMIVFTCTETWRNYLYVLNRSNRITYPGIKIVLTGFITLWFMGTILGGSLSGSKIQNALFFLPFAIMGSLFFLKNNFNRELR